MWLIPFQKSLKFEGGSLVMQYQFFPNKAVRGFVPNFSSNLFS